MIEGSVIAAKHVTIDVQLVTANPRSITKFAPFMRLALETTQEGMTVDVSPLEARTIAEKLIQLACRAEWCELGEGE